MTHIFFNRLSIVITCLLLLTGCASTHPNDPLEPLNRGIYKFNRALDTVVLKPVAKTYKTVTPERMQMSVTNFFSNLNGAQAVVNNLLQGNLYRSIESTWRLVINSTVGLGGFFDVASHIGLESHPTDFGVTLAKWGYKNSMYIVMPIFGPSTIRDAIGLSSDYYLLSVYPYLEPDSLRYGLMSVEFITYRAAALDLEKIIEQAAIDRYVFELDAFLQRRQFKISDEEDIFIEEDEDPYVEE